MYDCTMTNPPCQHSVADLNLLARGGRCPSCQAILTPEEFQKLADQRAFERVQEQVRSLEWAVSCLQEEMKELKKLQAEVGDLDKRLTALETKRSPLGVGRTYPA